MHALEEVYSEEEDDEGKKSGDGGGGRKMNGIEDNSEKTKKPDDEEFSDDEDDDDDEDEYDKTMLENFPTCIDSNDDVDEFIIFRDTLQCTSLYYNILNISNLSLLSSLTGHVSFLIVKENLLK